MTEFKIKYEKRSGYEDLSEEDQAVVDTKKAIDPNYVFEEDSDFQGHYYDYGTVDMYNVKNILRLDDTHTQYITPNGAFVVKLKYEAAKQVFSEVTGRLIGTIDETDSV